LRPELRKASKRKTSALSEYFAFLPNSDIGQSEAVAASRIKQQHLLYCPAAILTRSQTA